MACALGCSVQYSRSDPPATLMRGAARSPSPGGAGNHSGRRVAHSGVPVGAKWESHARASATSSLSLGRVATLSDHAPHLLYYALR